MICTRCQGLMREETVTQKRCPRLILWACFACGDRIDETIRFHRVFRQEETTAQRNERLMRQARLAYQQLACSALGGTA